MTSIPMRRASATATAVLPTPVGPAITITLGLEPSITISTLSALIQRASGETRATNCA